MTEFREISERAEDLLILERFYRELYVSEFPDADERESLQNMKQYLRLRAQGWYGQNNYHIVIALEDGRPCGGSISDFLADTSAGVIEFLVVDKLARGSGLGQSLLTHTEKILRDDANATGKELFCVVAEMNDPFKPGALDDCFDPFVRAVIWDQWGYGRLDFPYVQPALSSDQQSVSHLMLIGKPMQAPEKRTIPAATMKAILAGYMRWAMRIEKPEGASEYQEAARYIDNAKTVSVMPLDIYVGKDTDLPLSTKEITGAADPALPGVLAVYRNAFPGGPSDITPDALRGALARSYTSDTRYHLWAVSMSAAAPIEGVASFFTFPKAGFGGYVALTGGLKGTGRFQLLIARIEEEMLRDRLDARGWYIECAPALEDLFRKLGFRTLDIEYRQPPVDGTIDIATSPVLCLMFKTFGRQFSDPRVDIDDFLAVLRSIFTDVYQIAQPASSPWYHHIERQVGASNVSALRFR